MGISKIGKKDVESWRALERFRQAVKNGDTPDAEAMKAGLEAVKEKMDSFRKKSRKQHFSISSDAFAVVLAYVKARDNGERAYQKVVDDFCRVTGLQERQAKDYIRELKPRAKKALKE